MISALAGNSIFCKVSGFTSSRLWFGRFQLFGFVFVFWDCRVMGVTMPSSATLMLLEALRPETLKTKTQKPKSPHILFPKTILNLDP